MLLVAGLTLASAGWRARRSGVPLQAHRTALAVALSFTPVGIAIVFSAVWGILGAIVFFAVAIAVCGTGLLMMFVRGM